MMPVPRQRDVFQVPRKKSFFLTEKLSFLFLTVQARLFLQNKPVSTFVNHTAATVNLLEISKEAGVERFIYTSSTAAMGIMRNGMDETVMNLPHTTTTITKLL
jgi:nucleoside-diphosphate-sugar epimerase